MRIIRSKKMATSINTGIVQWPGPLASNYMKKCPKCKRQLPDECFSKNRNRPGGLSSGCKECHKKLRKKYYINHRVEEIKRVKDRRDGIKQWFNKLRQDWKCGTCGESRWYVLDLHHRDKNEKEYNIAEMVHLGWSKNSIIEEIKKCIVVCSNCHREIHHKERGYSVNGSARNASNV